MTRQWKATIAGILAAATCLGGVVWSNARERSFRRQELQRETRDVARQFTSHLQSGLEKHILALAQMAAFFENSQEVTREEFYSFVATTLKRTPLCLLFSAVDPSLRLRWVYPADRNESSIGFDVKTHPQHYETVLRAMQAKRVIMSPPLQLFDGSPGFILAAPIFRKGKFLGEAVAAFRSADFFTAMMLPEVVERFDEMVLDSGTRIFASRQFDSSAFSAQLGMEELRLCGRVWEIRVMPRKEAVMEHLSSGQLTLWTLGGLLALAAGCVAGATTYWTSAITTHFKSQRAALRDTRERLDGAIQQLLQAEKIAALGELVAGVAHEINNPLSTIMGYSQLLMADDVPADLRRRRLESVHSEAERIARIVKNLLTFARRHPPEKKYLGANGIIEKTLELKAYHFRVNKIEVEKDLTPDLPMTMLDFHQIQQVLLNLLNNAEQASVDEGRGGRIQLTTRLVNNWIEVRVSDHGPGIPVEIQSRIFEPFFTTKKEGKGTGLGLSLCYGIVQEHGGTIHVESQPGKGATFVIKLPVIRETPVDQRTAATESSHAAPCLKILVVDSEQGVQSLLVDLLSLRGHRVDTASDVPEAVRKIGTHGHDLIISDTMMLHGSGKDIYRAVVNKSPHLARRIIFTIGDGASAETLRFLKETGNEIVFKPYSIEQIHTAVANAIRN